MLQSTRSIGQLTAALMKQYRSELSILFQTGDRVKELVIDHQNSKRNGLEITLHARDFCFMYDGQHYRVRSLAEAFAKAAEIMASGKPLLDTVYIEGYPEPELYALVKASWAEACRINNVDLIMPAQGETKNKRAQYIRDNLMSKLRGGSSGVAAWNQHPWTEKYHAEIDLTKHDFSGLDLSNADMDNFDCSGARFVESILEHARFNHGTLSKVSFKNARLDNANICNATSNNTDFSGASLSNTRFYKVSLKKGTFSKANLTGTRFEHSDLRGANFSDSTMSNIMMKDCVVDEKTKWPTGFAEFSGLVWKGTGPNPFLDTQELKESARSETVEELVQFLTKNWNDGRLDKAMKMLKKDRFQLFSESGSDFVRGIVKSQTDKDLVYACSLNANGEYSCCTQNLNVCGGLKGALCKHLLVLIVGLTHSGNLSPAQAAEWSATSKANRPTKVDEDAMAGLLLKFKSAEDGEIDWRPVETMPEDYYSF